MTAAVDTAAPEIIHLLGRPLRVVSRKLIEAWHSDGRPLRYTAETVVRVRGELITDTILVYRLRAGT